MQEKLNNEVEAPNDLAAEEAGWKLQAPLEMLLVAAMVAVMNNKSLLYIARLKCTKVVAWNNFLTWLQIKVFLGTNVFVNKTTFAE